MMTDASSNDMSRQVQGSRGSEDIAAAAPLARQRIIIIIIGGGA